MTDFLLELEMSSARMPTLMGEFFDKVSPDYDKVHTSHIDGGEDYYRAVAIPITPTEDPLKVLDIGCGTGLELEEIFDKVPNATVSCVDLSAKMLEQLQHRFNDSKCKVTVSCESYLSFKYPQNEFDYIIASATLHHLLDEEKLKLFPNLCRSLKNSGSFILGDYYVSPEEAKEKSSIYQDLVVNGYDLSDGKYHIDIPTTSANEMTLLTMSGFKRIKKVWESSNFTIFRAAIV